MKGELKMDVNDYLPLRDVVFNTLRQASLRGEMEPGERLMEIQLADKLGVSRTPIREAIRKLELEGLVIMIPRKGAEVAHITEKDMRDVLEVRAALEELAATLACRNVTPERIEELKMANKRFEAAIISKDVVVIVICISQSERCSQFTSIPYTRYILIVSSVRSISRLFVIIPRLIFP